MRTLRALFLGLQLREKILVAALILLAAVILGSSVNRKVWNFVAAAKVTTADLAEQQQWLDNQASIEAAAKKTALRLVATQTLDANAVLATVSTLASESGLSVQSGQSRDEGRNEQFTVHTREFTMTKVDYAAFKNFYLALQARSPYIGIDRFQITPDRVNAAFINIALTVSAPEVLQPSE